jgi:hypothetical protein
LLVLFNLITVVVVVVIIFDVVKLSVLFISVLFISVLLIRLDKNQILMYEHNIRRKGECVKIGLLELCNQKIKLVEQEQQQKIDFASSQLSLFQLR